MPRKPRRRGFGQGSVYRRGAGGSWRICWREGGRQRYASGFPTRELAEQVLRKVLSDIAAGRAGLPPDPKGIPTLAELADDWLERRKTTHRSAGDDRGRWTLHLKPHLGHLRPDEVDPALLRRIVEVKLGAGLSSSTARLLMRLVSTFFSDLVERQLAQRNPAKALPRATRRLIRPSHDPRTTPFLEQRSDIRRVFLALPEPINLAFAVGALGGLRTGEVLALRWEHIDLERQRIHVQESTGGPLKDEDSRIVPIQDALLPLLVEWRLRAGGAGQVVPPMRGGSRKRCDEHTVGKKLRKALETLEIPRMTWYQATRHTFASQWVLGGGTIEQLREILGHSTVLVTERYAHLRPDAFGPAERTRVTVDLSSPTGRIIALPRAADRVSAPGDPLQPASFGDGRESAQEGLFGDVRSHDR